MTSHFQTSKYQAYRCQGKEVVLHSPARHDLDADGRPTRVSAWLVREIQLEHGEYTLGAPYEVPSNSLSLVGRAIPVTERID